MAQLLSGIVHGKSIDFDDEIGIPEGQKVQVLIRPITEVLQKGPWGEALRRCAGALANVPGLDEDMEKILNERKTAKFREAPG